jgi:hypothetical protein
MSDTDSIATIAGALLGAVRSEQCVSAVLDRGYITSEARRCAAISSSSKDAVNFEYVKPTRKKGLIVVGKLSLAKAFSEPMGRPGSKESYQWCTLPWAQTILYRHYGGKPSSPTLFDSAEGLSPSPRVSQAPPDGVKIAQTLASEDFDLRQIGRYILNCARHENGEHLAGVIAYELIKLYRKRSTKIGSEKQLAKKESAAAQRPTPHIPSAPAAVLQLQLQAAEGPDGLPQVSGRITNYGGRPATHIMVKVGIEPAPDSLSFSKLGISEDVVIDETIVPTAKKDASVEVVFTSDGTKYRQRGRFVPAVERAGILLMKGLDVPEPVL